MQKDKVEFYKFFLSQLRLKKSRNYSDAKAFEEKLFGLIGNDLFSSTRLEKIESYIKKVADRFDVFDLDTKKSAELFYKDFPVTNENLKELKIALTEKYCFFTTSVSKGDHKQAARYLILQLEGVLKYLEPTLIDWYETDNTRGLRYRNKDIIKTSKDSLGNSSKRIKEFQVKFKLTNEYIGGWVDYDMIDLVYLIRNDASHLNIGEKAKKKNDEEFEKLKSSPHEYYNEVFTLIKKCCKKIRSFS